MPKGKKVFIIAEAGKNFIQSEGDRPVKEYLRNAKRLAKAAKEAGADAIKFQTHNLSDEQANVKVVSPHFRGADRYSWVKRNQRATPFEDFWRPLKNYCDRIGITFFSTPMSRGAAKILQALDVALWKVGSGDLLDFVLLDYLASTDKPIIISSGMSTLKEIDAAVDFLRQRKAKMTLLHCVSIYPCPPAKLNLKTINFLRRRYHMPIGYSSHSLDWQSAVGAVRLGAEVIEKHFSFSRDLWGSDHKASLTLPEMEKLVKAVRKFERHRAPLKKEDERFISEALGTERKILDQGETVFRPFFRKTLVASRGIKKGEKITPEMLYAMRPQVYLKGLPSQTYEKVLGKITRRPLKKYAPITSGALG